MYINVIGYIWFFDCMENTNYVDYVYVYTC